MQILLLNKIWNNDVSRKLHIEKTVRKGREGIGTPHTWWYVLRDHHVLAAITTYWAPRRRGCSALHSRKGREGIGTPSGMVSVITTSWPSDGDRGDMAGGGCRTTPCHHQRRRPARFRPARDRSRGASSGNDALLNPVMAAPPGFSSRDRGEEGQSWRVGSRGFE
jgi:hypothetical protein